MIGYIHSNIKIRLPRSFDTVVAPEDFDNTIKIQHEIIMPQYYNDSLSWETEMLLVLGMVSFVLLALIILCCVIVYRALKLSRFVSPSDLLLFVWQSLTSPLRNLLASRVSAETAATCGIRVDETVRLDVLRTDTQSTSPCAVSIR